MKQPKPQARRRWAPDQVQQLITQYESLPDTGGARTSFLKEIGVASAQMSVWRGKRARSNHRSAEGDQPGIQRGVARPTAIISVFDSPDVDVVIEQLEKQIVKMTEAVVALRRLKEPVNVAAIKGPAA